MFNHDQAIQQRQYLLKQAEALKQQREAVLSQVALLERAYNLPKEGERNDRRSNNTEAPAVRVSAAG